LPVDMHIQSHEDWLMLNVLRSIMRIEEPDYQDSKDPSIEATKQELLSDLQEMQS